MARRKTAHDELAELDRRITQAKNAEREAQAASYAAESNVELARDAVREAADLNLDHATATAKLDQAKRDAEQAGLAAEGVSNRLARLTAERDRFMAANGERLLDELQPACDEACGEMRAAIEALLAAERKWQTTSTRVATYLRGMSLSPAENAPGSHGLESIMRDLRRAPNVTSPGPHFSRRSAQREEQKRVRQLVQERELV